MAMQMSMFVQTYRLKYIFLLFLFYGCREDEVKVSSAQVQEFQSNQADPCNDTIYISEDFELRLLERGQLYWIWGAKSVKRKEYYDRDSVPFYRYEGRLMYHPVNIVQYAFEVMDVSYTTGDTSHRKQLRSIAHRLTELALKPDSSNLLPYTFDFPLHGYQDEVIRAPWFSGMAQGEILSFLCNMFEDTGDSTYLKQAQPAFNSLWRMKGKGHNPWISCVDENGHLWLEEFPMDIPNFTLNGMLFAMIGLYDYYRITKDERAAELLRASLTTIKANIERYRNEGGLSSYCIRHKVKDMGYHQIHIKQLAYLHLITGDPYFLEMSEKFASDTPKDGV